MSAAGKSVAKKSAGTVSHEHTGARGTKTFKDLGFAGPEKTVDENSYLKAIGYSDDDISKLVSRIRNLYEIDR